jgi:hypothetical protein
VRAAGCVGETPGRPRIAYEQGGLCGGLESRCFPASKTHNNDDGFLWNCAIANTGMKPNAGWS